MRKLDKTDKQLLNELMKDNKQSLRELAMKIGVSFVTIKNRMKSLEEAGIIKDYVAKVDMEALGYETHVLVEMRIAKGKLMELQKKVAKHPNVYSVYDVTGDFDAIVFGRFSSTRTMDTFLKKIQTYDFIERTRTKLILNTIKNDQITL